MRRRNSLCVATVAAAEEARRLLAQIRRLGEPLHQAHVSTSAPTERKVYGVRVPQLRRIARGWYDAHQRIGASDLVALMDVLWKGESREERTLVILLLEHYHHRVRGLTRADFERWRRGLDSWEATDGLGWVLAVWVLGDVDTRQDFLGDLIIDEDVWSRRMALAATVRINRDMAGPTLPDRTLELVDKVKGERHPMVTKAVSWALREMVKQHRERVAAYLEANRDLLAAHVVREVSNKLETGLKSGRIA